MRTHDTILAIVLAAAFLAGCGAGDNRFMTDAGPDSTSGNDQDGDTISDMDEGRATSVDTDGDTVPDYQDEDSDGDTIPDQFEAGDYDTETPPVDSDADGIPDYRDQDSDGNGVLDGDEGFGDADGDGIADFADIDNDGDNIDDVTEIGGNPAAPVDFDGDGVPDYNDLDSDNDTITDQQERPADADTDSDLVPDRHDLDTDGDGIPDATEAGDADPHTWPRDTDRDGTPDFRDLDSDGDGLSDRWEYENGLDPYNEDSDLDGVPDLIEVGAGTDPLDASSNPTTEGNFFFKVPYEEDPEPSQDTLVFSTDIQKADVFFMLDTTGSMGGERENLKTSIASVIIPDVDAIIPDAWFGAASFDDYPVSPYGDPSIDEVFNLRQILTSDPVAAEAGVMAIDGGSGWDGPESHVPALYAAATGLGLGSYLVPQDSCPAGTYGYPCFRSGAVPIIVLMTDAPFHNGPGGTNAYSSSTLGGHVAPTYDETLTALLAVHAKVITINSGGTYGEADCRQIATDTGAVDISGTPLYFEVSSSGTGMGAEIVDAIEIMAHQVPIDVSADARDDDSDTVDAMIFIQSIVPNTTGGVADPRDPTLICEGGLPVDDLDGDTVLDTFVGILPGTTVCFDITPERNTTVPPTEDPQVFMAYVDVVGDGITVLSTRQVYFLVPPDISEPPPG